MTKIKFGKWSSIINKKFIPLTKNRDRYIILYGSRGSGKSDYVSKQLIFNCLTHSYFKCILYRRTYNTIQESSYETLKQNIIALGLEELFIFKKSPLAIECINGNRFIARGGDNALSLKSIKDPTCVWYEEEVPNEEDFATITLTIRATHADILQEFFTINPQVEGDYKENWFWKRFFENEDRLSFQTQTTTELETGETIVQNTTVHHSTYLDNRWLSLPVKGLIESYKNTNEYLYQVYAKGLWTAKETGGNFYKSFVRSVHVRNVQYSEILPLHITFDFNVNPYMTCVICQIVGKEIKIISELCLTYPKNTTLAVCQAIKTNYRNHNAGMFIYGDPQGLKNYTAAPTLARSKEVDYNEFALIFKELEQFRPISRVPRSYPPVRLRGDFINSILATQEQGISIQIDESCTKTITDFMNLKEASDGTKHKEKEKDPNTGVVQEKYGHCFVGETIITTNKGGVRIDQLKVGDLVLTRQGYRKVINVYNNGVRDVYQYKINNNKITCTPTHKIWANKDFYNINKLIGWNTFCIFVKKNIWKEIFKYTTTLLLQGIQILRTEPNLYIIQEGQTGQKRGYTFINTEKKSEKYQKATTFITKTITHLTTKLITWFVFPLKNTQANTSQTKKRKFLKKYYQKKQDLKPLYGMVLKMGLTGIKNTLKTLYLQKKEQLNVKHAERIKKLYQLLRFGGVLLDVKTELTQEGIEPKKRQVYDIQVEGCHEYFANNILVHNCSDSIDYLVTEAFKTELRNYEKGFKTGVPVQDTKYIARKY